MSKCSFYRFGLKSLSRPKKWMLGYISTGPNLGFSSIPFHQASRVGFLGAPNQWPEPNNKCHLWLLIKVTFPETNSLPLQKLMFGRWFISIWIWVSAHFHGRTVSFMEGKHVEVSHFSPFHWPLATHANHGTSQRQSLRGRQKLHRMGGEPNPDMAGCKTFQIEELQPWTL